MSARAVWAIVRNEQLRILAHKEILLFGLALPVIIITLIGLSFGSAGSIDLGVLDEDGSARSSALVEHLAGEEGIDLKHYDDADLMRQDVRTTAIEAGIVIPSGYAGDIDAGEARVQVLAEPRSEGVASALATIDAAVTREGVREAAIAAVAGELSGTGGRARATQLVEQGAAGLEPVAVQVGEVREREVATGAFSHTTPANLTLFVFINTLVIGTIIAFDRQSGLLARMLATPTSPTTVLLGIGLARLVFALGQAALLIVIGTVAFGVEWGDPLGATALVVLFAAISAVVGVAVGATVTVPEQAQAIGIPLAVGMGMLGGTMWPLDIVPRPMQILGHITPHAWAMDSWEELIFDGGSFADIAPNLAILAGVALVVGAFATRQLRRAVTG